MKPAARSFGFGKALLLVGALAGLLIGSAACADAEGTTPDCTQDVGDGTHDVKADGCNPFAQCSIAPNDPAKCCVDQAGKPFVGYELAVCLYGFGAGPAPTNGTSSSSSTSTSSTGGP